MDGGIDSEQHILDPSILTHTDETTPTLMSLLHELTLLSPLLVEAKNENIKRIATILSEIPKNDITNIFKVALKSVQSKSTHKIIESMNKKQYATK
jgi:hypothetical protein